MDAPLIDLDVVLSNAEAEMIRCTRNIPSSHGAPHALRVASFAKEIAGKEGINVYLARFVGPFHDLRYFDEEERVVRKLNISSSQTGMKDISQILKEFTERFGWPEVGAREEILFAIQNHNKLPSTEEQAPPLLRILRDADRLSRLGKLGLLSILEANRLYGVPFYNVGETISWSFSTPLIANEDIKSAITDVRACLSWWQIFETRTGRLQFLELFGANTSFLTQFADFPILDNYACWIRWALDFQENE